MIKAKMFTLSIGFLVVFSCRKSNYTPPVTPVLPDSLLNWNVIATLPGEGLSDIWFTSASRGFVLSDKIYQTWDGGSSWSEIPNTSGIGNFFNLFFVNAQIGFAQGSSQLAATVDGGNSWTIKTLPTTTGLTIFFVDPSVGFFGDVGELKKTTDAGNSWVTNFSVGGFQQNYYPYFLNSDTGFVVTGSGTCAATSDGGQTWQIRTTNLPADQIPSTYNQLFFLDHNNGFYACPAGVMKTSDGGQSWQNVLVGSVDGAFVNSINVIRFIDANAGYYKGLRAIYKTSDGGQTWSLNCKLGSDQFMGMFFLDIHTGWACTNKGRILIIQQ
jgi:photosystem II stability/assembly factor-like uncharacterized protein